MPVETIIDDAQTLANSGFYWRERGDVKVLICKPLEDLGFINAFSTRLGGVSKFPEDSLNLAGFDEDSTENIHENRRRFLAAIGGEFQLATAWQVHGNDVKVVARMSDLESSEERFDGLASRLSGVLVGVKTADCVPVLIGDTVTNAFAAVHAGWRGTAKSIVVQAVKKMRDEYDTEPQNLIAAIGPSAGCRRYEIGSDVIGVFKTAFTDSDKYFEPTRHGHALIDLPLANKDQLVRSGVPIEGIFTAPYCTLERSDLFFSYRLEKKKYGKSGRMLSVIGREWTLTCKYLQHKILARSEVTLD